MIFNEVVECFLASVASISAWALSPFIAKSAPWLFTRCHEIVNNFGSGATARAVTTSKLFLTLSDFPRMTVIGRSRIEITSLRKSTRRCRGSIRVNERSGRAKAITIPGNPAPEPISTTLTPSGMRVVTGMQLAIWRSQIRSPSRGPISPRSIPQLLRRSAYLSAFSGLSLKYWSRRVSRETVKLEGRPHSDWALRLQIRLLGRSLESCRGWPCAQRRSLAST